MALISKPKAKEFFFIAAAAAFGYVVLVAPTAYLVNLVRSKAGV